MKEIIALGHGGPRSHFSSKGDFIAWTKKQHRKYHYPVRTSAKTIVVSYKGIAFGHFEIKGKPKSKGNETVYSVRRFVPYPKEIKLYAEYGIRMNQSGVYVTKSQLNKFMKEPHCK